MVEDEDTGLDGNLEDLYPEEFHGDADSEVEADLEIPKVTAACELLDDEETEMQCNILDIVKACLADVKKIRTVPSIKMLSQLTAVTEYVKLQHRYQNHPKCTKPCLNASLAVARHMGKGMYFTCQIRYNEAYLLKHCHLPPTKAVALHGQYTLLDNEIVFHNV